MRWMPVPWRRSGRRGGRGQAPRPRVVVCGAGFGGLWAAQRLAGKPLDVLLLDRNNYHTFLPLLYQVATAELGPTDIAYPVRSIIRKATNVHFRMAEVERVDLDAREVLTGFERIPYDRLILALGSKPNFFGVEGAAEHAFRLREMADAVELRHHVLGRFESAAYERDPERRRRLLTFVVVGGGPTGVEYAGALAELIYGAFLKDFRQIPRGDPRLILLEAMDGLLPGMPERLGAYAADRLRSRRVEVRTGAEARRITPETIELEDGCRIETETVVWTAGVRGDPRVGDWGLPTAKGGQVPVTPELHLEANPEVYVVGDLAYFEQEGRSLPQVAPVAIQQGELAADNALRSLTGERQRPFSYRDRGFLAVIGRNHAVAHVKGRTFTGRPAWLLWLGVHVGKLVGFRNRLLVLVNWGATYLSFRHSVRLILPPVTDGMEPEVETSGEPAGERALREPGERRPRASGGAQFRQREYRARARERSGGGEDG